MKKCLHIFFSTTIILQQYWGQERGIKFTIKIFRENVKNNKNNNATICEITMQAFSSNVDL